MYFVCKFKTPKDKDVSIFLKNVKGLAKAEIPAVELVERKDMYYLFRVCTNNQIKLFNLNLVVEGQVLASRSFTFSVERIEYDIGLSYDYVNNKKIVMSNFEGLVASSIFNNVDQINFY